MRHAALRSYLKNDYVLAEDFKPEQPPSVRHMNILIQTKLFKLKMQLIEAKWVKMSQVKFV